MCVLKIVMMMMTDERCACGFNCVRIKNKDCVKCGVVLRVGVWIESQRQGVFGG